MRHRVQELPPTALDQRLADLPAALSEVPGLAAVYLIGSYGTPFQTPLSDLDLALVFQLDAVPGTFDEDEIGERIRRHLGVQEVSIVLLNRAPIRFQFRALEEGRQLAVYDPIALADFVESVLRYHGDYLIKWRTFEHDYDAARKAQLTEVGG